jgi:hypothetical protein
LTDRDSVVVTDLTRLASNRQGRFELGSPATFDADVPSNDFRVYFPHDDGFAIASWDPFHYPSSVNLPRLSEGVRLMYSLRREGIGAYDITSGDDSEVPWVCRHAGPVLEITDRAEPSRRTSHFTAFDPWAYLYQRPVRSADFDLVAPDPDVNPMPGEMGVVFPAGTTGDAIITELLRRTIVEDGPCYIDAGTAFGGTADYAGQIATTDAFTDPITFPRGMSVGEAWAQMADSGALSIVLRPIYDPINRPGYCAELDIIDEKEPYYAGQSFYFYDRPVFRWDRSGRSVIDIERTYNGRERANRIRAFSGGTGAQSNPWTKHLGNFGTSSDPESSWSDAASAARFGESWLQPTYVRQRAHDQTGQQAKRELLRRRAGERTIRFSPTPEFAPRPWNDYKIGSIIDIYNSSKLREEQWWLPDNFGDQSIFPRIFGFTIDISDDSLETVVDVDVDLGIASLE